MAQKTIIPVLVRPKDYPYPRYGRDYLFASFRSAQWYFYWQTGGHTFDLRRPVSVRLPETWDEIVERFTDYDWRTGGKGEPGSNPFKDQGQNIWFDMARYCFAEKKLPLSSKYAYYFCYLRPPTPEQYINGFGGMTGMENKGIVRGTKEATWNRPGMAMVADEKALLLCGKRKDEVAALGWDLPWWANDYLQALGAVAHEIVHIFTGLPHGDYPVDNITMEWWSGLDNGGRGVLTEPEIQELVSTGWLS